MLAMLVWMLCGCAALLVPVGWSRGADASHVLLLALCRAAQGVAMAATAPAGYALIGRAFPPDKLATATSRYAAAVSVGGALASASVLLDDALGWRRTFITCRSTR